MRRSLRFLSTSLLLLLGSVVVAADEPASHYVTEKGFKSKVLEVHHRNAEDVAKVLYLLGSGFKGAHVQPNSELRTITVRDFPENIATMEDALKRLDVPSAAGPDVELRMYVLLASNSDTGSKLAEVPDELKGVIAQLQQTLKYKSYGLAASIVQRMTDAEPGASGKGSALLPAHSPNGQDLRMHYQYDLDAISLGKNDKGAPIVRIGRFSFEGVSPGQDNAEITTALSLRDGERVVVGTAMLLNRALAVVLTADILD